MIRGIGYYVHHQGAGHAERARRIGARLARRCTLIGTGLDRSGAPGPVLHLPDDRMTDAFDGADGAAERPAGLHYAPLNHAGVRVRMAEIAAWIARTDPVLMIVDVSVEVALLARLLSVPTLTMRLAGARTDTPHLEAFRAATRLIAPFPEALDSPATPDWVRAKTLYAGFVGAPAGSDGAEDGRIVVVFGRGGEGGSLSDLVAAARAVPERPWHVLGPVHGPTPRPALPPNLHLHGWVEDVARHLAPAALVVGGGGDGVVAAVASMGKRFLCLPEPRPFGEQTEKAAALARLGAAVTHEGWPEARSWPDLVARALALDPANIAALARPDAVERIAAEIDAIADRLDGRARA